MAPVSQIIIPSLALCQYHLQMRMLPWPAAAILVVLAATAAPAHRLDEYLQCTILSIERDRVHADIFLTSGIAVLSHVLGVIGADADGTVTETAQRVYAERVLRDLSLTIDGHPLTPELVSMHFPAAEEMKEGRGEIQIEFSADLPFGSTHRRLVFQNHHESQIAAYEVNCLLPRDRDIRIVAQKRNYLQSIYQVDYVREVSFARGKWPAIVLLSAFTWIALLWRPGYLKRGS